MAELEIRNPTGVTGRNMTHFKRELGSDPRTWMIRKTNDLVRATSCQPGGGVAGDAQGEKGVQGGGQRQGGGAAAVLLRPTKV